MNYKKIDGDDGVVWSDPISGNSGVLRPGDAGWDEFQEWLSAGNHLQPIEEQLLTQDQCLALMHQHFHAQVQALSLGYSSSEIESWPQQYAEAINWLENSQLPTPLIDALMLPHEDKSELCGHIVADYTEYSIQMGNLIMWRRIATAAIESYFSTGRKITSLSVQYPEVPHAS